MSQLVQAMPSILMPGVQTRLTRAEEDTLLRVLREANTLSVGVGGAPENDAFERDFTAYIGCSDSVAVNSCSSALELAAVLSDLGPGDEVILPAHTFVASAVPFARSGATIRWADIDPDTRVVTAASIAQVLKPRTKVAVVVHLYGLPANMAEIMALAKEHGLIVVEDCAQAPGATYKGRRVGSIGHFGCFSFHSHKNLTTLGEGGMLTVSASEHGERARRLRWMGIWPFKHPRECDWIPAGNDIVEPIAGRWPFNYCLGEPAAAVGRQMLGRLDQINAQRQEQASRFIACFQDYPELAFQRVPDGCQHVYHLMAARYDGERYGSTRDDLIRILRETYSVRAFVQYWPLNRCELFRSFGFSEANVPETDYFFDNMISFPWWSDMANELIDEMGRRTVSALCDLRRVSHRQAEPLTDRTLLEGRLSTP